MADRGWTPAGEIREGDKVVLKDDEFGDVLKIEVRNEPQMAYNLDVEEVDTYLVGELGVWVHNACPLHKNSLDYVGETHVYRIKGSDGKTHKVGQSATGTNKYGQSNRAESQANKLRRDTGGDYSTEVRKTFPNKRAARKYETKVIKRFKKMNGENSLPGNKFNR